MYPKNLYKYQRFVSSIGNIEKAVWVFNYLGSTKTAEQKLNYETFEASFFYVYMNNRKQQQHEYTLLFKTGVILILGKKLSQVILLITN